MLHLVAQLPFAQESQNSRSGFINSRKVNSKVRVETRCKYTWLWWDI